MSPPRWRPLVIFASFRAQYLEVGVVDSAMVQFPVECRGAQLETRAERGWNTGDSSLSAWDHRWWRCVKSETGNRNCCHYQRLPSPDAMYPYQRGSHDCHAYKTYHLVTGVLYMSCSGEHETGSKTASEKYGNKSCGGGDDDDDDDDDEDHDDDDDVRASARSEWVGEWKWVVSVNEWVSEIGWMSEWVSEWVSEWASEWVRKWVWMNEKPRNRQEGRTRELRHEYKAG